jgi:valyl-tRNA synthetase
MIIAGYEYRGEKPFTNVYLTGIVRDKQGKKMSKSLGNSPEPLELISKYSADGVRVGMLLSSPAGNDLLFDESLCEQGRNFANKVWNAFRLVKGWEVSDSAQSDSNRTSIEWFESKFNQQLEILNDHYTKYRMSDALMTTYKLIWDDFCAWYLEMIKPEFSEGKSKPIDKATFEATIHFFEKILKVLHPWMPFITEEIWHLLKERTVKDCIMVANWPQVHQYDSSLLKQFEIASKIIIEVRSIRKQKNIPNKERIVLLLKSTLDDFVDAVLKIIPGSNSEDETRSFYVNYKEIITKMLNLSSFKRSEEDIQGAASFIIGPRTFFVPLTGLINSSEEIMRIKKELEYTQGFLQSVEKKLANKRFTENAKPEVLQNEINKQLDARLKIDLLQKQLETL